LQLGEKCQIALRGKPETVYRGIQPGDGLDNTKKRIVVYFSIEGKETNELFHFLEYQGTCYRCSCCSNIYDECDYYYYLGRFSARDHGHGILVPAWFRWISYDTNDGASKSNKREKMNNNNQLDGNDNQKNEEFMTERLAQAARMERSTVVELEHYFQRDNELSGLNIFVLALWVTRCSTRRMDAIIYNPQMDICYRIHDFKNFYINGKSQKLVRTLCLEDPVGFEPIDMNKAYRYYVCIILFKASYYQFYLLVIICCCYILL